MQPLPFEPPAQTGVLSVSALTAAIHRQISREFEGVKVAGEISGWKVWTSGHAYFTLKDRGAQIRCVLFRNSLRYLRFEPKEGISVICRGNVEVRAERGEYQLVVSGMEAQGLGRLYEEFDKLREKLRAGGLFEEARKRPLPAFPLRIGIVTSPQGAVIRDMVTIFGRRWPGLGIRLYPTQVQGAGSAEGIVEGIEWFSASGWPEVVIVARGGGSIEDLWSFNDERVARAIVACSVPVVSAVGHETDFTIADFVADMRAPTPSAAAELLVPEKDSMIEFANREWQRAARAIHFHLAKSARRLEQHGTERARRLFQTRVHRALQRVDELESASSSRVNRVMLARSRQLAELERRLRQRDLRLQFAKARERLQLASRHLIETMRRRLELARREHGPLASKLQALSPLNVLERGYSIVETAEGQIVKRASDAPRGTSVRIRLHDGRLDAEVTESVGNDEFALE
jgi:exodeoxyribonuclease VII large subunit